MNQANKTEHATGKITPLRKSRGKVVKRPAPEATIAQKPSEETILSLLKTKSPEQTLVVGPLVKHLVSIGWEISQMMFGKKEWLVPKSPSEATKREKYGSFEGFPCDITIFDSPKRIGDPKHVIAVIECKQPDEEEGISQLEQLLSNEPHVKFGAWCNSAESWLRTLCPR